MISTHLEGLLRTGRTGLFTLAAVVLSAGCHRYAPLVGVSPQPGDQVRIRLSAAEAERVSGMTGTPIRSVEGYVLRVSPEGMTVDVGWGAVYAGTRFEGRRDTLDFRAGDILEVDRREFSRARTAIALAGAVAAVGALFRALGGRRSPADPGGGDPIPF